MGNLAYDMNTGYTEPRRYEMFDGKLYAMASSNFNHSQVIENINGIFKAYLKNRRCSVIREFNVFFSKKDRFVPDLSVVCDSDKIKFDGIHGAPDLVVEALSPSTSKRDRGYKMRMYGEYGVKEYWIVDTRSRAIEVYLADDGGKLEFYTEYLIVPEIEKGLMTDEQLNEIDYEFSPALFGDLIIKVEDVFDGLMEVY